MHHGHLQAAEAELLHHLLRRADLAGGEDLDAQAAAGQPLDGALESEGGGVLGLVQPARLEMRVADGPALLRAQHRGHGQGGGAGRGPEHQMTAIEVHRTLSLLDHLA